MCEICVTVIVQSCPSTQLSRVGLKELINQTEGETLIRGSPSNKHFLRDSIVCSEASRAALFTDFNCSGDLWAERPRRNRPTIELLRSLTIVIKMLFSVQGKERTREEEEEEKGKEGKGARMADDVKENTQRGKQ